METKLFGRSTRARVTVRLTEIDTWLRQLRRVWEIEEWQVDGVARHGDDSICDELGQCASAHSFGHRIAESLYPENQLDRWDDLVDLAGGLQAMAADLQRYATARYREAAARLSPKKVQLACPECGALELGTIEQIGGIAGTRKITVIDGIVDVEHEGGTDVDWDSSTTVGVMCRACGWQYVGPNWSDQLKPAGS